MIPIFSLNKIYEDEDFVKIFREFPCISDKFFDLDFAKAVVWYQKRFSGNIDFFFLTSDLPKIVYGGSHLYKMPSLFNLKEYGIEGFES